MLGISLRRFQFSLRTLFLAVTLAAGASAYVGWQLKYIGDRREFATGRIGPSSELPPKLVAERRPEADPPLIRRLLGDQAYTWILVKSEAEAPEAKRLFPEATILIDQNGP